MMAYNVAIIVRYGIGRILANALDKERLLGWPYQVCGMMWVLMTVVGLLSFNLGNWYFGFHYFQCSSEIKFIKVTQDTA